MTFNLFSKKFIMGVYVPFPILVKCNVNIFAFVFFLKRQASLELHFQKRFSINVTSDEISSLPIVA